MGNPLYLLDGRATIHIGNVIDRLRDLPDDFFDMSVFSPPYWGLRDYGTAFWVDGDPNCDHRTMATTRTPWANHLKSPTSAGKHGWNETRPNKTTGGHCALCGARRTDYQIGLEQTLGQHIDVMVDVMAEVWRVLKPTGSVFLNYGDCYAAEPNGRSAAAVKAAGGDDRTFRDKPFSTVGPIYDADWAPPRGTFHAADLGAGGVGTRRIDHGGRVVAGGVLKPKDLCMIPNRLAIALQEWGWWVRSEIVWGKTNPMPDSSGRGRPSTAHEKIFLLTKSADADIWVSRDTHELSFKPDLSERCVMPTAKTEDGSPKFGPRWILLGAYYDASAVMQESSPSTHPRLAQNIEAQAGSDRAHAGKKANGPMKAVSTKVVADRTGIKNNESYNSAMMTRDRKRGVTPRHEGHINHHKLNELGRGVGRLLRNYEPAPATVPAPLPVWPMATVPYKEAHFATFPPELVERAIKCGAPPDGGLVLDPFGGAGTTAVVALRLGRRCHLIELKPEYVEMARHRLELDAMGEEERRLTRGREAAERFIGPVQPLPLFQREAAE